MDKKIISYFIIVFGVIAALLLGNTVFASVKYVWFIAAVSALSVIAFIISFEKKEHSATYLLLIAALTALSVMGRLLFAAIPAFKPVSAMVVITAIYFGPEAGFLTGALSALISNFYFGQGPWTVFQMAAWGFIGFFAGLIRGKLKNSRLMLALAGAVSGVMYSLLMDVWSAVFADGTVLWSRYIALVVSSAPFTAIYAVSTAVFLLLLQKPIGRILQRLKDKYGL
ncbi:MAG: ECF transporter S component [Oscillospiraceae bacterium]|nr:ECF transporter S component [Oscillospiraceae bacterium]